jgi:hypothetical protein
MAEVVLVDGQHAADPRHEQRAPAVVVAHRQREPGRAPLRALLEQRVRERVAAGRSRRQVTDAVRAGHAAQADVDRRQVRRALPQDLERAGRYVVEVLDLRELAGQPVQQLEAAPDDDRGGGLGGDVDDADDAGRGVAHGGVGEAEVALLQEAGAIERQQDVL